MADRLILKIFEIINNHEYEVKLTSMKGQKLGELIPDENLIKIFPLCRLKSADKLSSSPAVTLIHEILHIIYPKHPHKDINKMVKKVWQSILPFQKLALYEYIFEDALN